MSKNNKTVNQMIQEAVDAAVKGILESVELKIQRAFELGAEIGAAKGAEIGAQAAIEAAENERRRYRRARYDRQLRNTKLLLKHYRSLNSHYANAVWEEDDSKEEDSFCDIMELMNSRSYDDEVFVDSIKQSSKKTRIIMRHVNKMLEEYETMCKESRRPDDLRHWRVIKALYLSPTRTAAMEVAEAERIDKRTVYKDVDAAVQDLTMLLFGVEGIEKL
ncbi:MAG: hypothetical protein IJA35_00715 [Clostridia bacterium]|nr:hypothetical protein [Oscillospiraceae bacterium]MBQ3551671.1 hypothetical protein [Clostridia bacterium]